MEVYNLSQYKLSRMKQKINEGKKICTHLLLKKLHGRERKGLAEFIQFC